MAKQPSGYKPPEFKNEITLQLSRNESQCAIDDLDAQLGSLGTPFVSRYPSHAELQELIGQWVGVAGDRIVVTAGGDESIDRVMRTSILGERKNVITHTPSFEMVDIYCDNYGGSVKTAQWLEGDFPADELIGLVDAQTALVVLTSPNNPTGGYIETDIILKINAAAKSAGAKLLVDNAYIEFADQDPTADLVADDNIMIVRTFSKAWGLAGLRVGYLIAPTVEYATSIRNTSGPFPVSAVSLETARRALTDYQPQMKSNLAAVRSIRKLVNDLITSCSGKPLPSQGNFVLAEFPDAEKIWAGLGEDGVGIRKFTGNPLLKNKIRITCPVQPGDFLQLAQSLCRVTESDFEPHKSAVGAALKPSNVAAEATETIPLGSTGSPSSEDRTWSSNRETKETNIDLEPVSYTHLTLPTICSV